MNRRRNVTIVMLICAAIVSATSIWILRTPEPRYNGIPIHVFLDQAACNINNGQAYIAARELGTNCLPYVITALSRKDTLPRKKYRQLWTALPSSVQKFLPVPSPPLKEVDGANIFGQFGCSFIPKDICLLKYKNPAVRRAAAWSFGYLRRIKCSNVNEAIPALIEALNDPTNTQYAAMSLRDFGPDASNAIPPLTRILADTNNHPYLQALAASVLGKIGPAATNSAPTIRIAMQSTEPYLRGQAAVALWRVTGDVASTLPVLLAAMPTVIEDMKWDWIIALGEMGPRAKAALPQLQKELKEDARVVKEVRQSISQIQAEEPSKPPNRR